MHWDGSDPCQRGHQRSVCQRKIVFHTEMSGYFRESSALCVTENICLPLDDSSIKPQQLLVKSITLLTEYTLGWAFI